ncbi:hypothetical protein B0A48_10272 [Cryoendolithus antarcticus]|uniref:Rit1 N-terminal domain-containing protein n=1 Tax=Cryoendolithus antarcticus TaxID=1507870 RepID=A0A1V8SWS4_9PEZI|nr:hypothetical protein B0A48_10272 [Cryoendolithus antarcticus]
MSSPPLSLHSLIFPSASTSISTTLTSLKRQNLSITNRLRSIRSDASFVLTIADHFNLPLITNERCGSWYVPPERKAGSAYFKSTDGHAGQWAFSLRRLNLQVLDVVGTGKGCIIVDSTRRGKSMPDALSKTAPIWIAVLNRLLFPEHPESHWLRTPEDVVSASEHAQIDARLEGFVRDARSLDLDLPALRAKLQRPMRAVWITPETDLGRTISTDEDHAYVMLCTASSRASESSKLGAAYVQGAADDSEAWACGLDAVTFWANADALLATSDDALSETITTLMKKSTTSSRLPIRISPAYALAVGDNASLIDSKSRLQDYDVIVEITRLTLPLRQPVPSKVEIKKRLSWIMASIPDVSPSRATLQSVNAHLMG